MRSCYLLTHGYVDLLISLSIKLLVIFDLSKALIYGVLNSRKNDNCTVKELSEFSIFCTVTVVVIIGANIFI